ncbi:hypothetical protein MRB53_021047 [Persea americana]|uniref:Uncharacterized protein n=1 Tax=Persea americana TaxID=3435 RepID=A0ACC2L3A8_PERAE|nr:hypothetical protein MRB53_021047 [Persea americana]
MRCGDDEKLWGRDEMRRGGDSADDFVEGFVEVDVPIVHVSRNDGSILEGKDDVLIECEGLEMAISDDGAGAIKIEGFGGLLPFWNGFMSMTPIVGSASQLDGPYSTSHSPGENTSHPIISLFENEQANKTP